MKSVLEFDEVLLHHRTVDFRKSINGLTEIVQNELELDPFGRYLFVFLCKDKKKIKFLYWDETGFALWYKRLEKDRFPWPKEGEKIISITAEQLSWLLSGIDLWKIQPHKKLNFEQV